MTILRIKYLNVQQGIDLAEVIGLFEKENIGYEPVACLNWKEYPYFPEVVFRMAYSSAEMFLQFQVKEKYIRATCQPGDENCKPWEDSCVEFFISSGNEGEYYNFEFNCIGYCHIGKGKERAGRNRFSQEESSVVRVWSSLGNRPFGERTGYFEWMLMATIPFSIFGIGSSVFIESNNVKGNFYKCGDKLTEPHFLSWNPIDTKEPDFHRPEYFGEIHFL